MDKVEGVPFHGTPPNQKNVGDTVSSKSFGSKLSKIAGQAAYYGSMAALGVVGRKLARGTVLAGYSLFQRGTRHIAGRTAQAVARPAIRRAMGA